MFTIFEDSLTRNDPSQMSRSFFNFCTATPKESGIDLGWCQKLRETEREVVFLVFVHCLFNFCCISNDTHVIAVVFVF